MVVSNQESPTKQPDITTINEPIDHDVKHLYFLIASSPGSTSDHLNSVQRNPGGIKCHPTRRLRQTERLLKHILLRHNAASYAIGSLQFLVVVRAIFNAMEVYPLIDRCHRHLTNCGSNPMNGTLMLSLMFLHVLHEVFLLSNS